uniref:Uncharacterized protein n=1 Tax=viral metagenome TaxID=1070528 RepID=A0A6M3JPB9_9ZZZZ
MGSNFYHRTNLCDKCGRYDEEHIGKCSWGWSFSFHATEDIKTYKDWLEKFKQGGEIWDEEGEKFTIKEFKNLVKQKINGQNHAKLYKEKYQDCYNDPEGHSFMKGEFS